MRSNSAPAVAIVIVAAIALAATGCGSDPSPDQSREGATVSASTEDIAARAAEILDVPEDRVEVDPSVDLPPSSCRIHTAWDSESLDPSPLALAELPDGSLVDDRVDGAAERVLRACYLDAGTTPDPDAAALAITLMGAVGGPVGIPDPTSARRRLGELGIDFEDPSLADGPDGRTIVFYAENLELHHLLRVTAVWGADGALTVESERL